MKITRYIALASVTVSLLFAPNAAASDALSSDLSGSRRTTSYFGKFAEFSRNAASLGGLFVQSLFCEIKGENLVHKPILNDKGEIIGHFIDEKVRVQEIFQPAIPVGAIYEQASTAVHYLRDSSLRKKLNDTVAGVKTVTSAIRAHPYEAAGHALLAGGCIIGLSDRDVLKHAGQLVVYAGSKLSRATSINANAKLYAGALVAMAIGQNRVSKQTADRLVLLATLAYMIKEVSAETGVFQPAFPTLNDYQKRYNGGRCPDDITKQVIGIANCLKRGGGLYECRKQLSMEGLKSIEGSISLVEFSRQASGSVIRTEFSQDGSSVCYIAALNPHNVTAGVSETCFPVVGEPGHTHRILNETSLGDFYKGLELGEKAPVLAINGTHSDLHGNRYPAKESCALHRIRQPIQPMIAGDEVCVYSQTSPQGPVEELCYRRHYPDQIRLKPAAPEIAQRFLDEVARVAASGRATTSIVLEPKIVKISLLDAFKAAAWSWWHQKPLAPAEPEYVAIAGNIEDCQGAESLKEL